MQSVRQTTLGPCEERNRQAHYRATYTALGSVVLFFAFDVDRYPGRPFATSACSSARRAWFVGVLVDTAFKLQRSSAWRRVRERVAAAVAGVV